MGIPHSIQISYWHVSLPIIFGKAFHLLVELEYPIYWAIKALNFDIKAADERCLLQLNEFDKFRFQAYENTKLFKEKTKW